MKEAYKVIFCGSRDWTDPDVIQKYMERLIRKADDMDRRLFVIEGDCRGADKIAGRVADALGIAHAKVPANWISYGNPAGPIRNRWMMMLEPDEVIGFHENVHESRGTKNMLEQAGETDGVLVSYVDGEGRQQSVARLLRVDAT